MRNSTGTKRLTRASMQSKFSGENNETTSENLDSVKECMVSIVQLTSMELAKERSPKKGKKRKQPEKETNNNNCETVILRSQRRSIAKGKNKRRNLETNTEEKMCLSLVKLLSDDSGEESNLKNEKKNEGMKDKKNKKIKQSKVQVATGEIPSISPSIPLKKSQTEKNKRVSNTENTLTGNTNFILSSSFKSKKKIKIFIHESQIRQPTIQEIENLSSSVHLQEENLKIEQPPEKVQNNLENEKGNEENQNNSAEETQKFSDDSSLLLIDDETAFLELNDVSLELESSPDELSNKELSTKSKDFIEKNEEVKNSFKVVCPKPQSNYNDQDFNNDLENKVELNSETITLQTIVKNFISNHQLDCLRELDALKRGLCFNWLTNNYVCQNEQCIYSHNASKLFTKKLKLYPSKFIMVLVASMRNDMLFVDIIMAAFEIISQRQVPLIWVTFLVFFVFYVTEPSDGRFLKFWVNAARFYSQLSGHYSAAKGFASILSIFSSGPISEEWKITEFVKLIKQPPIQISINFTLLRPILKLDIPVQLLTEAVKSCVETQEDVLHVYFTIIPKIPLLKLPIHVVELLLKFCKTLETMNLRLYADNLKQRLKPKVQTFKIKIVEQDFPFTASFQNELAKQKRETEEDTTDVVPFKNTGPEDLGVLNNKKNYLEPNIDFYIDIIRALELTSDFNPSRFRNESEASTLADLKDNTVETIEKEEQINKLKQFFHNCQFDLLGKYLNELKESFHLRAAEELLKLLFQIKISLQQLLDLVKIMIFTSKNENSAKVVSCISLTLILNLVKINEWNKAYALVSLCHEKQINLVDGTVFVSNDLTSISQFRTALLLVEVNTYKENYKNAMELIKSHNLFSPNFFLWNLSWKEHDEAIRIKIVEEYLDQVITNQVTDKAHELFLLIRNEQKEIKWPIDLRKFANEILTLLLNQDNERAINFYEKLKLEFNFNNNTIRGILITLVRQNRLNDAKCLFKSYSQSIYALPDVTSSLLICRISSLWLEEEIYVTFETFFDSLAAKQYKNEKYALGYQNDFEVTVTLRVEEEPPLSSNAPLCLDLINTSFDNACMRIHRVFQNYFKPTVSFHIMSKTLKIDKFSLREHLKNRIINNFSYMSDEDSLGNNNPFLKF